MHTSTRLLTTFFLLVFLSPLLLSLAFKRKIKANEYVVIDSSMYQSQQHLVKIKQPKTLVVEKVPCVIMQAENPAYEVYNAEKNIRVVEDVDTLRIFFAQDQDQPGMLAEPKSFVQPVHLYLPVIPLLIVDGAELRMDSVNTTASPVIHADIRNKAKLNIGAEGAWSVNRDNRETAMEYKAFQAVDVRMMNSELNIGPFVQIGSLKMEGKEKSSVTVAPASRIDEVSASLSDSCIVHAGWNFTRKIQSIIISK